MYQTIALVLVAASGIASMPQAYQVQRQVLYAPPLPYQAMMPRADQPLLQTAGHQHSAMSRADHPIYLQPQHYLTPANDGRQPFVYVYSPAGGVAGGEMLVMKTRDEGSGGGNIIDGFYNLLSGVNNYLPWGSPQEKPAEAAKPSSEETTEENKKPEAEAGTRHQMLVPMQVYAPPAQMNDGYRPGSGALAFQRYLALAKQHKEEMAAEEAASTSTTTAEPSTTTSEEEVQSPEDSELGPSIAQAKPQAVSVAGPGGVAAAAPIATAVVGPGGMALSAPSATAVAGATKPSQAKLKAYFRQSNYPGYFFQF